MVGGRFRCFGLQVVLLAAPSPPKLSVRSQIHTDKQQTELNGHTQFSFPEGVTSGELPTADGSPTLFTLRNLKHCGGNYSLL